MDSEFQPGTDARCSVKQPQSIAAVLVAGMLAVVGPAVFLWTTDLRESQKQQATAIAITGGHPDRAPRLLRHYGCTGCHTVPGINGADGQTGGPLTDMAKRVYVAGQLGNNTDNLVKWIVNPQSFSPQVAMPITGVTEAEARDIAAYLYSH